MTKKIGCFSFFLSNSFRRAFFCKRIRLVGFETLTSFKMTPICFIGLSQPINSRRGEPLSRLLSDSFRLVFPVRLVGFFQSESLGFSSPNRRAFPVQFVGLFQSDSSSSYLSQLGGSDFSRMVSLRRLLFEMTLQSVSSGHLNQSV